MILISACSTSPVAPSEAKNIPENRSYKTEFNDGSDTTLLATVVFIRDSGFLGSVCVRDLTVNGDKAFSIKPGEAITLNMSAGEYLLLMETRLGSPCPNERESKEIILRAGEERLYRFSTASNFDSAWTRER